jgi:predicted phosphodiesterase
MHSAELKHRLIAEVKRVASEIGKVPTRAEFREKSQASEKSILRIFGGYSILLQAAGLKRSEPSFNPNDAFRVEVETRSVPAPEPKSRSHDPKLSQNILVLGDTHFPWVSVDGLCGVYSFIAENPQIDTVIQMGDLYDMYSWAKFPRSHLLYNPQQEIEAGRKMAEEMWATIAKMLPHARRIQILGNHDIRPIKKCLEFSPELEPFVQFKQFFQFDGVELVDDPREPFKLGDIWFMHGHLSGLGAHARKYLRNVVCGHTHRGGVVMIPLGENGMDAGSGPKVLFECNAGFLGDPLSRPMSYTPTKINEWTIGFAYIDQWGPRFIPL